MDAWPHLLVVSLPNLIPSSRSRSLASLICTPSRELGYHLSVPVPVDTHSTHRRAHGYCGFQRTRQGEWASGVGESEGGSERVRG